MKFTKIISLITLLGLAMVATSCKDDDEETVYLTFDGSLTFSFPTYVQVGEEYTLTPSGISRSDGGSWGICWRISPTMEVADTVRRESDSQSITGAYTFAIPDTLTTISATCVAFADGYSSKTTVARAVVLDESREGGSVVGKTFNIDKGDFLFTDPRDNREYYCTTIGSKDWFKENLAYTGIGVPFDKEVRMASLYGSFYTWEQAQQACPEGWRPCSMADWQEAASVAGGKFGINDTFTGISGAFMENVYFNGIEMWDYWPEVVITNTTGFTAMPVGYAIINEEDSTYQFTGVGQYSVFWTSDQTEDGLGLYRYMYVGKPDILVGTADKDAFAAPVRCVRDGQMVNEPTEDQL